MASSRLDKLRQGLKDAIADRDGNPNNGAARAAAGPSQSRRMPAEPFSPKPDMAPPASTVGVLGWLKENLFGSITSTILTILTIFLLYKMIPPVFNWAGPNAVVDAGSRAECRETNKKNEGLRLQAIQSFVSGVESGRSKGQLSEIFPDVAAKNLIQKMNSADRMRLVADTEGLTETVQTAIAAGDHKRLAQAAKIGEGATPPPELAGAAALLATGNGLVDAKKIPLKHGACWAVIKNRLSQLTYGFYPPEKRWRPILAFVGMLLVISAVLFERMPARRLFLAFAVVFPLLAYWLIWGGSVWGVGGFVAGIVGMVALYLLVRRVFSGLLGQGPAAVLGLVLAIVAVLWWWLFQLPVLEPQLTDATGFIGFEPVESAKLGGFLLTVIIGVTGIAASLPLGIALALGRQSNMLFIRWICVGFIEMIRGVPLITLLFVASTLLNYFLPPGTSFDIVLRVLIMVTLFASAYMAEVVRGGLAALPRGQYEASDALGMDYNLSMRFIVLPQALKISIPGIVNTFIGLFKDTTLVSIIGLLDPLGMTQPILGDSAWNGLIEELYVFIAVVFFIFCFAMSRYSVYLEKKLATGHAR